MPCADRNHPEPDYNQVTRHKGLIGWFIFGMTKVGIVSRNYNFHKEKRGLPRSGGDLFLFASHAMSVLNQYSDCL